MIFFRIRHHTWWPKEPIERKVIFLVLMLMIMGAALIGMDAIQKRMILGLDQELDNQSARRNMGKVLLNDLLQIERDVILLSAIEDERDLDVTHNRIQQAIDDIKALLAVLQKGGTFNHVRSMNFKDVNEVTEAIVFLPTNTSRYVIEVIELAPKIFDIEQLSVDMKTASQKKLILKASSMTDGRPFVEITLLRKQIEPVIRRSREVANKIVYDTNIRIRKLETTSEGLIRKIHAIRIAVLAGVLLFGLIASFRSLRQIKGIIQEGKVYLQDLHEKQNYINTILNSATVGITVMDATDHTIVEANPTALSMIGLPKEQVLGGECHNWLCASKRGHCPITEGGRKVHNKECTLNSADGRKLPVVKNATRIILNGRPHLVESFIDISQLKKAQEKARRLNEELEHRVIERTNQLQSANQELTDAMEELKTTQSRLLQSEKMASIGQLAAGVAHEINNPVGFVKSNLNTITEYQRDLMRLVAAYEDYCDQQHPDNSPGPREAQIGDLRKEIDIDFIQADFKDVLHESTEGINRVADIVADLKNFAHMNSDQLKWADINAGIESSLKIVWNELKYKTEVHKDLGTLPQVNCYPQRLNQVFVNLLVNAGHAIDKKGNIHIKTRAAENSVIISISDTGGGIAPEHISKIFDPFFTTKDVGKGTGLGLNVAYNIIKSHQGHVDVQSTPGVGTTFTIRLPINATDVADPASA